MRNYLLLCLLVLMAVSKPIYAAAWGTDCSYNTDQATITLPSNVNISIDPDAPVGQVLYRYTINRGPTSAIVCNTAGNYSRAVTYFYESGGDAVTLSGKRIYKTDVPGIGLIAWWAGKTFPYTKSVENYSNDKLNVYFTSITFDVELIKYDNIPDGTRVVNISALTIPNIAIGIKISNSSDTARLPNGDVSLIRFSFASAAFNVLNATCDTPDVSVNLGNHHTNDANYREGGKFASPWTDASIRLINCPIFYGTGKTSTPGRRTNNIMTVTLMPGNATTSSQGIMPVDAGSNAATGVGIQLAYGTSASPQLVDFSSGKGSKNYTMSPVQGATYTIPLVARYMQTAPGISDIRAGKANGKVTYLINYY